MHPPRWLGSAILILVLYLGANHIAETVRAQEPQVLEPYDIVVYGGTSGGVIAAIEASHRGRSVLLIEPSEHLGGLTSGGLGATDIGNKRAIGGLSRLFYARIKGHYSLDQAWIHQPAQDYPDPHRTSGEGTMWTFEPHVAESIFNNWIEECSITLLRQERLDRSQDAAGNFTGVRKTDGRIEAIRLESGRWIAGRVFIDATYEGDLMAAAGVSYIVGREPNATYQETLNGVQTAQATKHQVVPGVDPYVIAGDRSSGLLPDIDPFGPGVEGEGDHRVQAYCLRMCVTDVPENRIEWSKPANYDPLQYELLLRNFEAGETRAPWNPIPMPNRKTDTNNNFGFSTDWIGHSYTWAEASYAERDAIYQAHRNYQAGLMWTLANDPRVPQALRTEFQSWGPCRDEFIATQGWSHQLYVREARRMIGQTVMTQHHCQGKQLVSDAIGMAAYTMDSHHVQRHIDANGFVRNEGDVQVGGFSPYPISYGAIVPQRNECTNLLVPVALSASHIAYGSIRMEPVFMVLGQSAATAADLAIADDLDLQAIDVQELQQRLIQGGQVLEWTDANGLDPKRLPGVVLDDSMAQLTGAWSNSTSVAPYVGRSYLHDGDGGRSDEQRAAGAEKPLATATFDFGDELHGDFRAAMGYTPNPNRASQVKVEVHIGDEVRSAIIDQRQLPEIEKVLQPFATINVVKGQRVKIVITNANTNGHLIIDSAALLPPVR